MGGEWECQQDVGLDLRVERDGAENPDGTTPAYNFHKCAVQLSLLSLSPFSLSLH